LCTRQISTAGFLALSKLYLQQCEEQNQEQAHAYNEDEEDDEEEIQSQKLHINMSTMDKTAVTNRATTITVNTKEEIVWCHHPIYL